MRIFLGVFPPLVLRRDIHATLDLAPRGPRLRWTRAENLHITMQFLGEVDRHDLAAIVAAVETVARDTAPFEVLLQGLGAFPNADEARVLFVETASGVDPLRRLWGSLQEALPPALRPETSRPFHPHLTIARPKRSPRPELMAELRDELAPWSWRFAAASVDVVESHLDPAGARYSVRHSAALTGLRPPFTP